MSEVPLKRTLRFSPRAVGACAGEALAGGVRGYSGRALRGLMCADWPAVTELTDKP